MITYKIAFIHTETNHIKHITVQADKFLDALAKAEKLLDDPAGYSFLYWD